MANKWSQNQVRTDSLFFSGKGSPLPDYITREDINEFFNEFESEIKTVVIFRNSAKQSQGKGFVTFTSDEVAAAALNSCRGRYIDSFPVYLNYFKKRGQPVKSGPAQVRPTAPLAGKRSRNASSGTKSHIPKVENFKLMVSTVTEKLPVTVSKNDLTNHFNSIVDTPAHSVFLSCDDDGYFRHGIIEYHDRTAAIEAGVKVHETKLCDKHVLYVKLESPLDHLKIITMQCSVHELVYLRHYFHDKKTYTFSNCTVNIIEKRGSLKIAAPHNDLKPAEVAVRKSFLQGLLHSCVTFHCDDDYITIFHEKARALNSKPQLICIVEEKETVVVVHVFGRENSWIEETTKKLKKLNTRCKTFSLHPEAPRVLKSLEQKLELLAQKHHTVMKHVGQYYKAVRLYGLQVQDIDNAWKDIKNQVDSTVVTETVSVTSLQLKYLQDFQADCLTEIETVAQLVIPTFSSPGQKPLLHQISIKAELRDIVRLVNKLKKAASKCVVESFQISCSQKHLLPWQKRWNRFVQSQCSREDIYVTYYVEPNMENELCTISFDICADNRAVVEEVKNIIVEVENGQAFTEHTVSALSQREIDYVRNNKVAVINLLQQTHTIFVELEISNDCSISIFTASELDAVKFQEMCNTLLKHFQGISYKRFKFLDPVAGVILVKEKLPEIKKHHQKIVFTCSSVNDCIVIEMQGVVADINAAEAHIEEQLNEIVKLVATDQLILDKTSFPILSSSTIPLLKDQLLSCSYPTLSHRESLLGVKCVQTSSGHIVTIELCDDSTTKQCHPDAVLCTRDSITSGSSAVDICVSSKDHMTVTYLPALVDVDIDVTAPKCEVNVNNCSSLSEALLTGLNEIHPRKYGVITIKSLCSLKSSSKWLLEVLSSLKQYLMLHPTTTLHTIHVVLIPPVVRSKNEFDHYSFSEGTASANTSVEVPKKDSTTLHWYWKEHGEYIEYDHAVSNQINSAWACNKQGKCQVIINSQLYDIDFKTMTQKNLTTGFSRSIKKLLSKNDQPSSEQQAFVAFQWSYLDDTGNFSGYTSSQSKQIESMYSCNSPVTTLSINGWEYSIDFDRMVQVNTASQRERPIKREPLRNTERSASNIKTLDPCDIVVVNMRGHPLSIGTAIHSINTIVASLVECIDIPYPSSLSVEAEFFKQVEKIVAKLKYVECTVVTKDSTSQTSLSNVIKVKAEKELVKKAQSHLQTEILRYLSVNEVSNKQVEYPSEWEPQSKPCQLFLLGSGSSESKRVVKHFKKTLHNVKVVKIYRIQNKLLWEKYQQDKKRICEKNNGNANEMELFHGSRSVRAKDIVKGEDGLDMRYSAEGMWGRANYFAVNASYSDGFAYEGGDSRREMIVAKVLTGDSYFSPPDRTLRMPPEKPSSSSSDDLKVKYDTVNGVTNGSRVYMTYSNEKAYPAYVITYHHNSVGSESLHSMSSSSIHASPAVSHSGATPPQTYSNSANQYNPSSIPTYNSPPRPTYNPSLWPSQRNPPPRPTYNPSPRPSQRHPPPSPPKNREKGCALM